MSLLEKQSLEIEEGAGAEGYRCHKVKVKTAAVSEINQEESEYQFEDEP